MSSSDRIEISKFIPQAPLPTDPTAPPDLNSQKQDALQQLPNEIKELIFFHSGLSSVKLGSTSHTWEVLLKQSPSGINSLIAREILLQQFPPKNCKNLHPFLIRDLAHCLIQVDEERAAQVTRCLQNRAYQQEVERNAALFHAKSEPSKAHALASSFSNSTYRDEVFAAVAVAFYKDDEILWKQILQAIKSPLHKVIALTECVKHYACINTPEVTRDLWKEVFDLLDSSKDVALRAKACEVIFQTPLPPPMEMALKFTEDVESEICEQQDSILKDLCLAAFSRSLPLDLPMHETIAKIERIKEQSIKDDALKNYALRIAKEAPLDAMVAIDKIVNPELKIQVTASIVKKIVRQHTDVALKFAAALEDGLKKDQALYSIMKVKMWENPSQAEELYKLLRSPVYTDKAIVKLAEMWVKEANLELFLKLVENLKTPQVKALALAKFAKKLPLTQLFDKTSAINHAVLIARSLQSEDEKAQLFLKIVKILSIPN